MLGCWVHSSGHIEGAGGESPREVFGQGLEVDNVAVTRSKQGLDVKKREMYREKSGRHSCEHGIKPNCTVCETEESAAAAAEEESVEP